MTNSATYCFVTSDRQFHRGSFVLHVNNKPTNLRQRVLEVVEVGQQIHNGVANFTVDRFSISGAHQWSRIVWNTQYRSITHTNCNDLLALPLLVVPLLTYFTESKNMLKVMPLQQSYQLTAVTRIG